MRVCVRACAYTRARVYVCYILIKDQDIDLTSSVRACASRSERSWFHLTKAKAFAHQSLQRLRSKIEIVITRSSFKNFYKSGLSKLNSSWNLFQISAANTGPNIHEIKDSKIRAQHLNALELLNRLVGYLQTIYASKHPNLDTIWHIFKTV